MDNRLAVVFPGQASQKVGMLSGLSENAILKETFSEASEVLGYNLWDLTQRGPVEELNKTCRAQPAILAASVAIWRIWCAQGGRLPKFMAGHSLGEYSALVCSGVIDFSAAIKLVESRGILMQMAVVQDVGVMSAVIGLDKSVVISVCQDVRCNDQFVSVSVFNAPNYVIISGYKTAVERVNIICKALGAKFVYILPITIPSHCKLMMSIAEKFERELEKIDFLFPSISVINNVDVSIEKNPDRVKQALIRQLYTPVRWYEIIEYLLKFNINTLIEMGPSNVLSTMVRRCIINSNLLSMSVNDVPSLNVAIKY
ncbi:ACP S-malonyltransferase [Blochmannia endosymbiont of Polyrhachis (Hedomyrma) turneri]|uniref:ACP S-malonyltransferase n=1 Tax=Blochmannia endosymbiont of Polyrhachis (Hedomyrma) turneri TaxID=1505596 RepID=UPI00061A7F33|nr:ACP S-malonyltransferase [Blochmannia endosymbiont of Polyrhachis (Hedomyrma) turneri]AKC59969.1 Malonyl CoA-acyl carrier protein transacylase [Blochmannia endosymbiont of Polyrhachis (Hedomyrma) turneri]